MTKSDKDTVGKLLQINAQININAKIFSEMIEN
jgi:hypothetical protein